MLTKASVYVILCFSLETISSNHSIFSISASYTILCGNCKNILYFFFFFLFSFMWMKFKEVVYILGIYSRMHLQAQFWLHNQYTMATSISQWNLTSCTMRLGVHSVIFLEAIISDILVLCFHFFLFYIVLSTHILKNIAVISF